MQTLPLTRDVLVMNSIATSVFFNILIKHSTVI